MNCLFCGREMKVVYLVSSSALSYTENPDMRHIVNRANAFNKFWSGVSLESFHCPDCNWFMFKHPKRK